MMTEQEKEQIRFQYNRLRRIEKLEEQINMYKETKYAITGSLCGSGQFAVDWTHTIDYVSKFTNEPRFVKEVFNYDLTRPEFNDILKQTIYSYLDKKIAEIQQDIENI